MTQGNDDKRRAGRPRNPISHEELLTSASKAFAELGYSGASMSEIAKRVNLRKASLFHHFSSKKALYTEVINKAVGDLGTMVLEADLASGEFPDRIDRLGDMVVRYLGKHRNVARLLMREMVEKSRFAGEEVKERVMAILGATAIFLESGMEAGAMPRQDPRQLALSIVGLHLTYYAAPEISSTIMDGSIFSSPKIEERSAAVQAHVRQICGIPSPAIDKN